MKKVHWKTRQAIIRQHEQNTRVIVAVRGLTMMDLSVRELRLASMLRGSVAPIVRIELESLRPFCP